MATYLVIDIESPFEVALANFLHDRKFQHLIPVAFSTKSDWQNDSMKLNRSLNAYTFGTEIDLILLDKITGWVINNNVHHPTVINGKVNFLTDRPCLMTLFRNWFNALAWTTPSETRHFISSAKPSLHTRPAAAPRKLI